MNIRFERIIIGDSVGGMDDAVRSAFVASLPYLEQAYGRVEPIEYSQWHGHMSDNRPCPYSEESQMIRTNTRARFLQSVHRPQRDVDDY